MIAKKYDYIIIYSILFASILTIAALVRLLVISELQIDEFSGLMAFVIVCLLLGAAYLSFQSIIDVWLLPVIERAVRKEHPRLELEPEVAPIESTPYEEISVPNYDEYKQAAQHKIQQEQTEVLENVLTYTVQKLALYLTESELQKETVTTIFSIMVSYLRLKTLSLTNYLVVDDQLSISSCTA